MPTIRNFLVQISLLAFLSVSLTMPANAAVLSTGDYLAAEARAENLAKVNAVFAREDVRQYLVAQGVNPDDALARVAQLPDQDVAQIAGQLEDVPAGGSILALIGAVFVVLIILELTGVINIFKK
ncbi:MAG: PA2779 family protein [Pseudomonadales bacterium]|jgi:hypothetical protein